MFKDISHIDDIRPFVSDKKEIRWQTHPNGLTVGCYMFMDQKTFDLPEAIECRGIAFDSDGAIVSRPLHKFFNVGEKEWLLPEKLLERSDIHAIYEKLDGSMIATAWINDSLQWRSKKSFSSHVVRMTEEFVALSDNARYLDFANTVASNGLTAIFELTHPEAQIVVSQEAPALRLLHVRDNTSGAYVMLNPAHYVHDLIIRYRIPVAEKFTGMRLEQALESLADMKDREGYIIQLNSGEMMKVKCPWYLRLHRAVSFLRERDIALLALNEELDDTKGLLVEAGIDLSGVNAVEAQLRSNLTAILDEVDDIYENGKHIGRKDFALAHKSHPLFGLVMQRYSGNEVNILDWYKRHRLKTDFGLDIVADHIAAEELAD